MSRPFVICTQAAAALASLLLIAEVHAQTLDLQVDNLVALYRFDEGLGSVANDAAQNDGVQTAFQHEGQVGWTTGVIGGAVDFDGASSLIADDAIGEGAEAFTISLWVNIDNASPGYDGIFSLRSPENATNNNWGINYEGADANTINLDYRYSSAGNGSAGTDSPDGDTGPNGGLVVGNWVHAAMTWTADGSFRDVYMNGVDVGNAAGSTANFYNGFDWSWRIGDDDCCGDRFLDGQVDEIAVWNIALSASEIESIYNNGLLGIGLGAPIPPPSGDANDDGLVNSVDLEIIRANYGRDGNAEGTTLERIDGDLVNDNVINFDDYGNWKQLFPKDPDPASVVGGTPVPEPNAFALLSLAILARRRRR
ncbi:MAG: hypothetical protein KDA61_16610 [Planctomycetales bacterium]|nr:hypothetical protein [Planctomycetales bacterium]